MRLKTVLLTIVCTTLMFTQTVSFAGNWTKEDTYREVGILATGGAGVLKTITLMDAGEKASMGYYKSDANDVLMYAGIAMAGHAAIAAILPPKWRAYWQYMGLGTSTGYLGYTLTLDFSE